MKSSNNTGNLSKEIRTRDVFTLVLVIMIIILVYFSINNRHKENLDFVAKNNATCRELSLISRSIAKTEKTGFENILPENIPEQSLLADKYIRDLFSKKIAYQKLLDEFKYPYFQEKAGYGMILPTGAVIWFKHLSNQCDDKIPCGILFIDVNNKEKPNEEDFDRTVQKIYKDGIKCEIKFVEI